jgi:hypothetical protein
MLKEGKHDVNTISAVSRAGLPLGMPAITVTTVTPLPVRPPAGLFLAQGSQGAQEEEEAHRGGHGLHHYTPRRSFCLKKDVKPDGLDVVA